MKRSAQGVDRTPGPLLKIINFVPLPMRVGLLERIAMLGYAFDARHRRIALRNLALAFPDKPREELLGIVRSVFRNLGRVLAEIQFIPRLNKDNLAEYITIEGAENFWRAEAKGKGVFFLTAHFGNWEWMAATFPIWSNRVLHVVVRPLDNPLFDRMVERLRTFTGNQTIAKQKAMARILQALKKNEMVGILLDQNMAWQEGVFVDFFGELACTNVGLALAALKTGSPVLPAFNIRQEDGRYRVVIEPELPLIRTGNKELDVAKNTELFTKTIERYVRNYPDHWFWLHQRWKTRPWQAKRLSGT